MSRVAKSPIEVPSDVTFSIESDVVKVSGKNGELKFNLHPNVVVETDNDNSNVIHAKPKTNAKADWALAGTTRAIIANMVEGVAKGFEKTLEINGVGYRAQVQGNTISLSLGFSHPVEYNLPEGIAAEAPNQTTLIIKGVDKQLVGQVAANIREFRKPEPYKGKGIRYKNEIIFRKEAKKK